jgi:hypothetical protein
MRELIDIVEGKTTRRSPMRLRAAIVIKETLAYANSLGVEMHLDYDPERKRIMMSIYRRNAPPGSGAKAMQYMLNIADEQYVPIVLDVDKSTPRLIQYYWQFGFRAFSIIPSIEKAEFEKHKIEWEAYEAEKRLDPDFDEENDDDIYITFMDRPIGEGPDPLLVP